MTVAMKTRVSMNSSQRRSIVMRAAFGMGLTRPSRNSSIRCATSREYSSARSDFDPVNLHRMQSSRIAITVRRLRPSTRIIVSFVLC